MTLENAFGLNSNWKFNTLGVYNFTDNRGPYYPLFEYISAHMNTLEGDILEAGTYKGRLTAALAIHLKNATSKKVVHTYDTFSGFPKLHPKDQIQNFKMLFEEGKISETHWDSIRFLQEIKEYFLESTVNVSNISTSLDFSDNSLTTAQRKFRFLGLDNIEIYVGDFVETMVVSERSPKQLFLSVIDCDLYEGYQNTLKFVWPKTVAGGLIFLDEYYSLKFPGPRYAVDEFLNTIKNYELIDIAGKHDDFERWAIRKNG